MAARNRVTPFGEIVAIDQRGLFLGNRGCVHRDRDIVRPWQVRRWITCVLEYKGWVAPKWQPGRWTPLFFWDEAVALAAGHRPCALCRRADFNRWLDAWASAFGDRPRVDAMDRRLHRDRVDGRTQRRHTARWSDLPDGTFVLVPHDAEPVALARSGRAQPPLKRARATRTAQHDRFAADTPALVLGDRLVPWSAAGYADPVERPRRGEATVLTPAATVEVLRHGYVPVIHPAAG